MADVIHIKPVREVGWQFTDEDLLNQLAGFRGSRIVVPIQSRGGYVFTGLAIYNILRGRIEEVETRIMAIALSMGGVIAQAASKGLRKMPENGYFMLHNARDGQFGDDEDMERAGGLLKMMNEDIAEAYSRTTNLSKSEVLGLMKKETWINAKKALEMGLVDELTVGVDVRAHFDPTIVEGLSDKENLPDGLYNKKNHVMNSSTLKDGLTALLSGATALLDTMNTAPGAGDDAQNNAGEGAGASAEKPDEGANKPETFDAKASFDAINQGMEQMVKANDALLKTVQALNTKVEALNAKNVELARRFEEGGSGPKSEGGDSAAEAFTKVEAAFKDGARKVTNNTRY